MNTDTVEYDVIEGTPIEETPDSELPLVQHTKEEKALELERLIRNALVEERLEARVRENKRALKSRVSQRRKANAAAKLSRKRNR